ncbi:XdhC family protein [Atlantibacter subterranea]|uniref:XdhC family protein n=2 Tax=Atlantibacter subterraneus TaxID=255519 RepID=A0A427V273_9ENTR|nr:XdhC family protein [Atlantibacter subterranea]RSE03618.1 XdhC family protein [Atlantibacter subterranea]RSE26856.1 XdhC family protein [Atlantibacter subterranea]
MTAALVTLVEIRGGAARPLGAQMAVRGDGQYCGFVSGGCVESAVAWEALEAMLDGEDRTVVYGEGSPYFDIVLPCGGGITLTVHILRAVQPLLAVLNSLEQRQTRGLRYSPGAQTLTSSQHQPTGWHGEDFVVNYRPCVRVMIPGHSLEAQVTARMAQAAGFDVHTCDSFNPKMFDADTAVLLLYHDLHRELPLLQAALAAQPFYIGALGSRRTHEKRVAALIEAGWSQQDIARIKAPIGIFPKARDAHSLALSVLADVAAARHAV